MNAMHCPYPLGWSLLDEGEGQTGITTFSGLLIWFVLNFVKISSRYRRMFEPQSHQMAFTRSPSLRFLITFDVYSPCPVTVYIT